MIDSQDGAGPTNWEMAADTQERDEEDGDMTTHTYTYAS